MAERSCRRRSPVSVCVAILLGRISLVLALAGDVPVLLSLGVPGVG